MTESLKVIVLPFGWCVHIFEPGARYDTFLVRCYEAKIFAGFDWFIWGRRIVSARVNHLPRNELIRMVEQVEQKL